MEYCGNEYTVLRDICDRFELEIFRNVFIVSGYVFHGNMNYSVDTESDSDVY